MTQTAGQAIAAARFETDGQEYRLLRLPAGGITAAAGVVAGIGGPFCALVVDDREVSLILPGAALTHFQARLPDAEIADEVCSLITASVAMEPELTGFVARISDALAQAGVPVLPLASFSRDHFLVPTGQLGDAMKALEELQQEA